MKREVISTASAPQAIGTYSQALRVGDFVFISGQVPLDPATGQLVSDDVETQIRRVFDNLKAVAEAAGCTLNDAVRLTVFMLDLGAFPVVNQVMSQYLREPYPTRSTVGIASLPRGARIEIDAILHRPG